MEVDAVEDDDQKNVDMILQSDVQKKERILYLLIHEGDSFVTG